MTGQFDINDPEFVDYFIAHTGYAITECECGWEAVKREIETPTTDVWRMIRHRLQRSWEQYQPATPRNGPTSKPLNQPWLL
jgi:hypothetical protein